ncbi:hypothetical protein SAMN05421671_0732 [Pimelobacter simplex]|nr:hypothetical protein SAMN05421671_0732 [Pimelobacter simplex]
MALDWGTFSVTLVGPIAAGMACAAYVRMANAGVASISLTSTRPLRAWLQPAFAVWAMASVAVVGTCLVTTTAASLAGSHAFPTTYWVVVPALCVLAANVGIGVLVASLGRRQWLVPVAATLAFAVGVLSATGAIPEVFRTGGVTGPLIGETFASSTLLLQSLAALGVAVLLCWGANLPWTRSSAAAALLGGLVLVPGVAAAGALSVGEHERYRAVDGGLGWDCAGQKPQVCMSLETSRNVRGLAKRIDRQASLLKDAGVQLPDRFVQLVPVRTAELLRSRDGVIDLSTEDLLRGRHEDETATDALTMPRLCPEFVSNSGPPEAWYDVRRQLGRWILFRDGALTLKGSESDAKWLELPVEQQSGWLTTTYAKLSQCDIDSVQLPW